MTNKNIHIAICGHEDSQEYNFIGSNHYKFYNLNKLSFDNDIFAQNTFGESRILLAKNIFNDEHIQGTITASWSKKYMCGDFDTFLTEILLNKFDNMQDNEVFCMTACYGKNHPNYHNNPIYLKNFQINQRQAMPFTNDIQNILKYITGFEYDESSIAPFSNQIITNNNIFNLYRTNMIKIIYDLLEAVGENFSYYPITKKLSSSIIDQRRAFAYLVEEAAMLWWSKQKNLKIIPLCEVNSTWYSNNQHLI
jgi:hypothetical protein